MVIMFTQTELSASELGLQYGFGQLTGDVWGVAKF